MLAAFRKIQKTTLIIVTILIVIAFAFLYSDFDFTQKTLGGQDCVFKVDNRCYRLDEARKLATYQNLGADLGLYQFINELRGPNRKDMDPTNFAMNLIVLRKEAEKMGVVPSPEDIRDEVPKLPIVGQVQQFAKFQEGFDVKRYINSLLGRSGMSESDLSQIVSDYLCYKGLKNLLGAGIQAVPIASESSYIQRNQRYTASLINFERKDFLSKVEISQEDIQQVYEERNGSANNQAQIAPKPNLEFAENPNAIEQQNATPSPTRLTMLTEQQRGFDYVKFTPNELAEDATEEQKTKKSVTFQKAINVIYAQLIEDGAGFVQVAQQAAKKEQSQSFSMEIAKHEAFTMSAPPEALATQKKIISELFSDTYMQGKVSIPFPDEEGSYYVFKFSDHVQPRPMTLEEATSLIEEELKLKKSKQLTKDAAYAATAKLKEAITGGSSILDAANANSVELVTLPNFSAAEPPADATDPQGIIEAVAEIEPGGLSEVMERSDGDGFFVTYVDKVEIYKNDKKDTEIQSISSSLVNNQKDSIFLAWLKQRGKDANIERINGLQAY